MHPRKKFFRFGLAAAAFMLLLSGAAQPARAAFGEMVMLRGKAVVLRGGLEIHVVDRIELEDGDRVRTGPASKAHVRLGGALKGAEAIVTAATTFNVSELKPKAKASPFQLLFGAIRARVQGYLGLAPYMQTPTATVGIKGTDFIVYVMRKQATEFIGVEGLIEAGSRSRPEFSLRIGHRQWGEIVEGEKPKAPVRVPDKVWDAALREFSFPQS